MPLAQVVAPVPAAAGALAENIGALLSGVSPQAAAIQVFVGNACCGPLAISSVEANGRWVAATGLDGKVGGCAQLYDSEHEGILAKCSGGHAVRDAELAETLASRSEVCPLFAGREKEAWFEAVSALVGGVVFG